MKKLFLVPVFSLFAVLAQAQDSTPKASVPDSTKPVMVVDAACGQCRLGLPGGGCDLAVRIDGKSYFVDGTAIDDHGDAHADDGFCKAVRKAKLQGTLVNDRFVASYFKLLPATEAKKN